MSTAVVPGDRIRASAEAQPGEGTHTRGKYIYAAQAGCVRVTPAGPEAPEGTKPLLEVIRGDQQTVLPQPGSVILAKVARVNPRLASVDILCVGAVQGKFSGVIRQQDVRLTEIDKVDLYACFRPGDVVRAEVLSLGDSRSYYLSTAKDEYGVVHAKGPAGEALVPLSWQDMQCPVTRMVEKRKVAKPSQ